jgi:hypothetical protein
MELQKYAEHIEHRPKMKGTKKENQLPQTFWEPEKKKEKQTKDQTNNHAVLNVILEVYSLHKVTELTRLILWSL